MPRTLAERAGGRHVGGHAVAVFAPGADVLVLATTLGGVGWLDVRMVVCASLTLPTERVLDGPPSAILTSGLDPGAPTVIFVLSERRGWHPRAWVAGVGRLFGTIW